MTASRFAHHPDPARVEAVQRARTQWRHEVADLGGPNTLLWHRTSLTGTFDLNLAHPGGVAKLLSGRATLLSELVREHVAFLDASRRIGAIRDKVTELRHEHGLETGYLAIGLATWTLHRVPMPPRAPVLLRACAIRPTDAAHSDYLIELDQDVVFNPVLEHYLRSEAHLDLDPAMLVGLSAQSHGFDPRETYRALEQICVEMTGFGIGPQMVIGTFPWAKLPLVTSYTGDVHQLAAHDLVAALAGAEVSLTSEGPDPERADDPQRELSALDADHAQRLVIDEAVHGASLVLDSPTGTGATQTVANIIVAALSEGRSVLVSSEERSALDGLRRRLSAVGLGDLCLHLSEDPVSMRTALAEVRHALEALPQEPEPEIGPDPLPSRADALATLRAEHEVLHTEHEPWGLSLADVQEDLAVLGAQEHPPTSRVRLPLEVLRGLGPDELSGTTDALIEAADAGAWSRGSGQDPWYGARLTSADEAARAQEIVARLVSGEFATAREKADAVAKEAGLPTPVTVEQWGTWLRLVDRVRETLDIFGRDVYDAPLDEMVAATASRDEVTERPGAVSRARLRRQVRSLLRPGTPPADLATRVRNARDEGKEWEKIAGRAARPVAPESGEEALTAFTPIGEDIAWLSGVLDTRPDGKTLTTLHLDSLLERLVRLDATADRAPVAATAHPLIQPLRDSGLGELVDDLAQRKITPERVGAEVRFVHRSSLLHHLRSDAVPQLQPAETVREAERAFRRADRAHLQRNAARARRAVLRRLARTLTSHSSQVAAWERSVEAAASGPVDIRDVISRSPEVVRAVRPVVLASPLVVPTVLPSDLVFDLVVLDRAGRTSTARSVPALAHGRQVIVTGDGGGLGPRQFSVMADPRVEHDLARNESDEASLLDDAAAVLPVRHLQTHYRALDQGLVAPLAPIMSTPVHSFPGVGSEAPVKEHVVEGPVQELVAAAVDLIVRRGQAHPDQSLLVAADDESTVEDLTLALRRAIGPAEGDEALGAVLPILSDESGVEPLLVRTTARIAGEVRDHVVWVGGPAAARTPGRAGAVLAAARRSVDLVTGTSVSSWPKGAGTELVAQAIGTDGVSVTGSRSAVLAELARRLEAEGLIVHEGLGHGPHAVDLAVASDELPDMLLVAVDVDAEVGEETPVPGRDEIRLRHEQLTRMGWVPVRVRSSDVFTDPAREVARVLEALREAVGRASS
ncbi:hypothetical protein [Ornithinimicrobium panacihumi]|uniref:hypothetical protein n=1 Tax=Ornithinimicrobium panacihumi TaxID=2008449 RepID=UPI003F8A5789